jgi:hypothetical protein
MLTVVAQIIAPVALRATSALMDQIAKASFVMTNSIFARLLPAGTVFQTATSQALTAVVLIALLAVLAVVVPMILIASVMFVKTEFARPPVLTVYATKTSLTLTVVVLIARLVAARAKAAAVTLIARAANALSSAWILNLELAYLLAMTVNKTKAKQLLTAVVTTDALVAVNLSRAKSMLIASAEFAILLRARQLPRKCHGQKDLLPSEMILPMSASLRALTAS